MSGFLSTTWSVALGLTLLASASGGRAASAGPGKIDFNRDIRPILSDNCYACHGPDEKKRKAKLRLDLPESAFAIRDGHAAIKPKDVKASELWKRITTKVADDLMPPAESHKKLKPEQIEMLKRWIEAGAQYQGHWSFTPPVKPELPRVKNTKWTRNSIDHFIAAKFESKGLSPSPEATREVLIRRVTFDLTGLPPTPAGVDDFLADKNPNAYEKLVDRLLLSQRYGEHSARYWLDAARYGDTHGLHLDNERSMWPYRDWVVKAFNDNLPFDQFTIWQLAGDQLPNATREQQVASGFNRCNVTTSEGGSIAEEFVVRYAVDRTETTSAVWMGLTAGCAVCHDHKFDPITQRDFYSLYAFFFSAADPAMDGNKSDTPPILKLATPEQQKRVDELAGQISVVEAKVREALKQVAYTDPATLEPPPPVTKQEVNWLDDEFPAKTKAGVNADTAPLTWVTSKDGPVQSGKRALKRTAKEVAQDFFTEVEKPVDITKGTKLYAHVFLDPKDLPKAIMVQFHTDKWSHRANWGDAAAIAYGEAKDKSKTQLGELPKAGEWVRLEFDAEKIALKPGTRVTGMAFTQFGGTVYWDKAGFQLENNPATDPSQSLLVWQKENQARPAKELPKEIADLLKKKDRKPADDQKLREHYLEFICVATRPVLEPLRKEADALKAKQAEVEKSIPLTFVMADLPKPREAFILARGQYNKPTTRVYPDVPAALPPLPKTEGTNRLDLAKWLVDGRHPLTARVTVNRFWQQFFGTGLVKTAGDFGAQGEAPSHPELLDWLATTFVSEGWDMKQFVKLIVMSATYRQDSKVTPKTLQADPDNRLLARGPRFRLDAEVIRDNALFVSGLLTPTIGGKPVRPYQPENIWEPVAYSGSNTREYKADHGDALYRRSLYTFIKRTAPAPAMSTFDAPSREQVCVRRERSNTPLQALLLMNDVQHFEAARNFAQRLLTDGGATPAERLTFGFRMVTARKPEPAELKLLQQSLDKQLARYRADKEAAAKAIKYGESPVKAGLDESELAAYTLVANLLLNLDEAVTKN